MPFANANGIRLSYQRQGSGEPVLLIMGSGAAGRVWTMYQTPALHLAGYQTIVFDNRGVPPSDAPAGRYCLDEMVADTRGLIEALGLGPCRIVGTSLGALIAQELAIRHPQLVRCAVLMATRARADVARRAQHDAELALLDSGVRLPPRYAAAKTVMEMFSPATVNDDAQAAVWLEVFSLSGPGAVAEGQAFVEVDGDRRAALAGVGRPCRVIAFTDDRISPPHLGAEVAAAVPGAEYVEIAGCGHLGNLERPDEVNAAIIDFLDRH